MTQTPLDAAVRHVRGLVQADHDADLPDRQLLERFLTEHDEAAFTALVRRHGPLVLGVCRRVLGQEQDAEDAFQATFLVLARKATSVHNRDALASWLYGVAHHVARKARGRRDREKPQPAPGAARPPADPVTEVSWREVCAALEEELARLPEKYRAPLVLCYLEGRTRDDAARRLGWGPGRVKVRLERGRRLLRTRLARRGVTLSLALLAAALAPHARAVAVPAAVVLATGRLALQVTGRQAAAAPVVALAGAVLRDLARVRLAALAVVLAAGFVVAGAGVLARPKTASERRAAPPPAARNEGSRQPTGENAAQDGSATKGAVVAGTVKDQAGNPTRGAHVWLREGLPPRFQFRSTEADPRGRFHFADVAAGSVIVVALAPGRSYAGQSRVLQDGQIADELNLVLTRPQELRLSVTDEEGKPVQGAVFEWLGWKTARSDWAWLAPEIWEREKLPVPTSDRNGTLVVAGIPEGAVCSGRLRHPSFARQEFTDAAPGPKPVAVRLDRGWLLRVIALDAATGKPAPRATVSVSGRPSSVGIHNEPVGPDGELTLHLPKAEDVTVYVRHPELICPTRDVIRHWPDVGHIYTAKLRRRAKARGRVIEERTGRPLAGVCVGLNAIGVDQIITNAVSDAAGKYEIEGPEGPADVQVVDGSGYWAERGQVLPVQLDHARPAQAPDLVARQLPKVRGTVLLPDGRPAARAAVVPHNSYSGPAILTDAVGRFEVPLRYPEPFLAVTACHLTHHLSGGDSILFEDRQKDKITFECLEKGRELRIRLQPESEIRGTVLGDDGKPREGLRVWLNEELEAEGGWSMYPTAGSCVTNRQGRYRFPGLNRWCRYRVTLDRPGENRGAPRSDFMALDRQTVTVPPLRAPAADWPAEKLSARQPAPELACRAWLNSPPRKLADLRGKVVLLDFWATWCGPCTAELPKIQLAHQLYADKGLVVIGLHHHSVPLPAVAEYVKKRGLTYPIGLDDADGQTCGRYNVTAFPTKVLIGRDGKVVGELNGDFLEAVRREVLYGGDQQN